MQIQTHTNTNPDSMRDDIEHTIITMKTPVPKKGGFFIAVHRCATADRLMPRVLTALGIGPAMGSRQENDVVQFDLLARTALFNLVPGNQDDRMRILDPTSALKRNEVNIAMKAFSDAGVPCVLHSLSDLIRDKTPCVVHGINLYRHTPSAAVSLPPLPPTCDSCESSDSVSSNDNDDMPKGPSLMDDDDTDAWTRDHYGSMAMSNDDDADEQDRIKQTAASTIVRLPRALLAPFADAIYAEMATLGVECTKSRLASVCDVAKNNISSLQCLSNTLDKTTIKLRKDNHDKMVTLTELKAKNTRMDADILRMTTKNADTYAALLIAREDAAKMGLQVNRDTAKLRAECSMLTSEAVLVAAKKAATEAALREAQTAANKYDEELTTAVERAEVRAALAMAVMDHMEEDRAAAAADIARLEGLTQAAICLAAEAAVEHTDANDNVSAALAKVVELTEANNRLHMEIIALQDESELLTNIVHKLRPEMEATKVDLMALQSEKDTLQQTRSTLDGIVQQRMAAVVCCNKVLCEINDIHARYNAAVRARLHALDGCRQAEAQAGIAARDMASMEAVAADHRARASRVRDMVADADADMFRACIELDIVSGGRNRKPIK